MHVTAKYGGRVGVVHLTTCVKFVLSNNQNGIECDSGCSISNSHFKIGGVRGIDVVFATTKIGYMLYKQQTK